MIETIAFLLSPFLVAVCLVGIHAWFGRTLERTTLIELKV